MKEGDRIKRQLSHDDSHRTLFAYACAGSKKRARSSQLTANRNREFLETIMGLPRGTIALEETPPPMTFLPDVCCAGLKFVISAGLDRGTVRLQQITGPVPEMTAKLFAVYV
jgi:hypothetical protein